VYALQITVEWDNAQKTIIRQIYSPTWEWDEYLASFARINQLADEVDHLIGVVAEAGGILRIPPNAVMYGSRAIGNLPPNVIAYVAVTPSRLSLSIIKVIRVVTRFNLQVTSSVEAARAMIEAQIDEAQHKPG
jgi:hypothetical protein